MHKFVKDIWKNTPGKQIAVFFFSSFVSKKDSTEAFSPRDAHHSKPFQRRDRVQQFSRGRGDTGYGSTKDQDPNQDPKSNQSGPIRIDKEQP